MEHPQSFRISRYFVLLLCNIFMTDALFYASVTITYSLGNISLPESRFRLQKVLGFDCVLIYSHCLQNNVSEVTLNQVVNLTTINENAEALIVASKEIGLEVNTDKTKYKVMS